MDLQYTENEEGVCTILISDRQKMGEVLASWYGPGADKRPMFTGSEETPFHSLRRGLRVIGAPGLCISCHGDVIFEVRARHPFTVTCATGLSFTSRPFRNIHVVDFDRRGYPFSRTGLHIRLTVCGLPTNSEIVTVCEMFPFPERKRLIGAPWNI